MKKIQLTIITLLTYSSYLIAGGDINPVTHYEVEDVKAAEVVEVVKPPKVVPPLPLADVLGAYVAVGVVGARYNTNCGCGPKNGVDKTAGIMGRVGYDFNEYFGVEGRGMRTNWKSDGSTIKHVGIFLKPMYPIGNKVNIYGLSGYAKTTTQGRLRRTDVMGLAFGAGVEYDLSNDVKKEAKYDREFDGIADQEKGFGLFMDYERLFYKSGSPDLDAISAGITYDF